MIGAIGERLAECPGTRRVVKATNDNRVAADVDKMAACGDDLGSCRSVRLGGSMKAGRLGFVAALALVSAVMLPGFGAVAGATPAPTPKAVCGPGSLPETNAQGRVSAADVASGRAAKGYTCNTQTLSQIGTNGGYRVHRYVDRAGHECAFFDTTLLFPTNAAHGVESPTGVWVLDMTDPAHPVHTATLSSPAMQSPHESLSLNLKRGLLGAVLGNPATYPGIVDIYDISGDCRAPVLKSSLPTGILGHEGAFSPDGNTFWATSVLGSLTAIDVTNPATPLPLYTSQAWMPHGLNVSDDGNRIYFADLGSKGKPGSPSGTDGSAGMTILDVSQIQSRTASPKVAVVSHLTWPDVSIPQTPIPVTISTGTPAEPHQFLVEVDEFSKSTTGYAPNDAVGAARIINIDDETKPVVVSDLRLEVNEPAARAGDQRNDPGASNGLQGYAGHYCAVPQRAEPGIVACSFILSGLRVFDIRNPNAPKEIAYFNAPITKGSATGGPPSAYAMSAPAFVPGRAEIWYSDGNSGFWAVRVTNGVWTASASPSTGPAIAQPPVASSPASPVNGRLPATGSSRGVAAIGAAVLAFSVGLRRRLRRRRRTESV